MIDAGKPYFLDEKTERSWRRWGSMQKLHCTMVQMWQSWKLIFYFWRWKQGMDCRTLGSMMSYPYYRSLFQAWMSCLRTRTRPSKWSAHWDSKYRKYMLVPMTAYCFAEITKTWIRVLCAMPHDTKLAMMPWCKLAMRKDRLRRWCGISL